MTRNHRNRSWRAQWTCEPVSRTAVHKSGARARVRPSPSNPSSEQIALEDVDQVDLARWDIGRLTEQAIQLWMEGEI